MTDQDGKKSVRERAIRHMKRILAASSATATGVAINLTGCTESVVCDPLPPPINCTNNPNTDYLLQHAQAEAKWQTGTSTTPVVEVSVRFRGYHAGELSFNGAPSCEKGTFLEQRTDGDWLRFTCRPESGVTTMSATVPIKCKGTDEALVLTLNISGTPTPGTSIAVSSGE